MTMVDIREEVEEEGIESVLATLQPLRDLAKNWDIDIASCLEEYLQDLVVDTFPDSLANTTTPGLNFAQAALVLQNSSNIYSRKVEYLYALVYKSLHDNFHNNNNKTVARQKHSDPDIDDFLSFDPNQEFLLLDDVLPVDDTPDNRNIDLVEKDNDDNCETTPSRRSTMTRFSSTTNKSVTSINDVAYKTLLDPDGNTSLRLLNAPVAEDGWLRLPGTRSSSNQRNSISTPLSTPRTFYGEDTDMPTGFGTFDNDDDDDDDEGPGFAIMEEEDDVLPSAAQHDSSNKTVRRVTFAEASLPKRDPWSLLDPHSIDSVTKARPLKVGKSTRLPEGITEPPSACVTGARTRRIIRPPQIDTATTTAGKRRFDATESFQKALGKQSLNESHRENDDSTASSFLPLQGLAFGDEFLYMYQATTKRLAAERRELKQQEKTAAAAYDNDDDDDDENYGGGFAFGGDDDDDDDDRSGEGNTGMASLDALYDRDSDENKPAGATFEELCRAHLRAFAREAEKYASETKLTQRVDQWQQRLQPLLQEEEERPVFDIHEYGNQIIKSMETEITRNNRVFDGKQSAVVDFSRVTRHKSNFEVCRLFLASLSLTNSGNVCFAQTSEDGNSLSIELLNRDVEFPTENYLAPSARELSEMTM